MEYRVERDALGEVRVPSDVYWGAQTERSRNNFRIGEPGSMPVEIIRAFGYIKKGAAIVNNRLGVLSEKKKNLIVAVCDEIIEGRLDSQFPLVIWQTGSGTQTNMNVNEVIVNRAHVMEGGSLSDTFRTLHPNDDVNRSQSSNDTFPAAMHVAAYSAVTGKTIPALKGLRESFRRKVADFNDIVKIGRTHMMDAVPMTLGQEFSAYGRQLDNCLRAFDNTLPLIAELALGGSAVGTGLNTPEGFPEAVADEVAGLTGFPFITAPNKFESLASHDSLAELGGTMKRTAVALMKIANDIRLLGSGPRCGLGEIILPANEPGSSIMPGKINPTQVEAMTMVCAQVIGNDAAITIGAAGGQLELNTYKPLIAANILQGARLIADASNSFSEHCIELIRPDIVQINRHLENSLMLITALTPHIGYDKSATIAKKAYEENITLREAALSTGYVSGEQFAEWVRPGRMTGKKAD